MTDAPKSAAVRVRGKPFTGGDDPRRNAGGLTKEHRDARAEVKRKLDEAFTGPDGRDELVDAIKIGVATGDGTCIKLACEYRWGKPPQELTGADGKNLFADMPTQQLAVLAQQALIVLGMAKKP